MFGIMFKQIFITLICFSFLFLATACQAEKEVIMPDKPLEIALNMTAKDLYDANPEYKAFQEADAQPMGVTFQGYDFPTNNMGKVIFHYSDGSFNIDQVVTILAMDKVTSEQRGLNKITVDFFFDKTDNGISDADAYQKMMFFFKELQDKGWTYAHSNSAPRLTAKDSFTFATTDEGSELYLDYSYPLTFKEWMQLNDLQLWRLIYGTEIYMDIRINRQSDPETGNRHYLISLDIFDELELIRQIIPNNYDESLTKEYSKLYGGLPEARLFFETKAIKMGLKIQQNQPDYTLPLVLKETGIDTSKFISIDPYKITYEEFMQRSEAGEDMTPYYENQPTAKPEITSQARGHYLAEQPCPKSGYWFTLAKADSRAYFKQDDTMPDYPNNNWGEVIWQFEGKKG